ncbi:hypothetical protein ACQ4LE_002552 [Meloidogyne hapla]
MFRPLLLTNILLFCIGNLPYLVIGMNNWPYPQYPDKAIKVLNDEHILATPAGIELMKISSKLDTIADKYAQKLRGGNSVVSYSNTYFGRQQQPEFTKLKNLFAYYYLLAITHRLNILFLSNHAKYYDSILVEKLNIDEYRNYLIKFEQDLTYYYKVLHEDPNFHNLHAIGVNVLDYNHDLENNETIVFPKLDESDVYKYYNSNNVYKYSLIYEEYKLVLFTIKLIQFPIVNSRR